VLDIALEDTKKYIGDVAGTRVGYILYYITFQTRGCWEARYKRCWGMFKRPQKLKF